MWVTAEEKDMTAMVLHGWAQPWRQGGGARDLNGAQSLLLCIERMAFDICTSGQAVSQGSFFRQIQLEGQQTPDKLGNLHVLSISSINLVSYNKDCLKVLYRNTVRPPNKEW